MLRQPFASRNIRRGRFGSLATAVALTAVGVVALTQPALAQRERRQPPAAQEPSLSAEFGPLYQPVAAIVTANGDVAAAKAQVPAMVAAIKTDYDRFFAGNLMLQLGNKANDRALQKQGLELMVASNQAQLADLGLFRYFLGGLAFEDGDFTTALTQADASLAAGFAGNLAQQQDPWLLKADSLIKLNRTAEALQFLRTTVDARSVAGQTVPDSWLARGLGTAYEQDLNAEALEWAALRVRHAPNAMTWRQSLQVVSETATVDPKVRLDLYRLMALTGSLTERADFGRYIEAADPRSMSNEVSRVLAAALAANAFTASDNYYQSVKSTVDANMAKDRADAPTLARQARAAAGTARDAQNAGDVYLSLENYAEAEAMYTLGLDKPGADRDLLLTRLGIAQAHQNKNAEAKATFAQVGGERAAVARLWSAYVDSRG